MKNKIISFDNFTPQKNDLVLLDTNILINIMYPADYSNTSTKYDKLYAKLIKSKSSLIISSIQISEFINRCIRLQYNIFKQINHLDTYDFKKNYRNSDDYKHSMEAILDIVNTDIIPNFTFIDDHFSKMKKTDIFKYGFSYDFNDALICEIAKDYDAIFITDDSDFANYLSGLHIVTSNKLLQKIH